MDSQAQLKRTQAEKPIRINHPEEEEHHEKGPLKVVKKVKEKAKKIKKALTKHGHGHDHHNHDRDEEEEDDEDNKTVYGNPVRDSSNPGIASSGVSEKEERKKGSATLTPHNTPVSSLSARGQEEDEALERRKAKGEDNSKAEESINDGGYGYGNKVAAMVSPVYEKVKETGATVMTKLPFSQQMQDKGVSAREYLTEKLSPGEEDKALSEVVTEKLHMGGGGGGEKKGIVTQSEEVEKRLGGFSDQRSEEERKHGEAFAEEGEGGMVEKLRGAVTSWISGTTEEVTQKSTESSSNSLASTVGDMVSGGGGQGDDNKSGSVPLQKRFQ